MRSLARAGYAVTRLHAEMRHVNAMCDRPTATAYWSAMARHARDILRDGSLTAADRAMQGRACTFLISGRPIVLDGAAFGLAREIYGRRAYFASNSEVQRGDLVVDLGANAGVFSVLAAHLGARVIAVEAQAAQMDRLAITLRHNPSSGSAVSAVHGLVGPGVGVLSNWGASEFGGVIPPTLTVDGLLERFRVDRIDFLKVDIEGSEFALTEAGGAWLGLTNRIAMEVHTEYGDPEVLVEALKEHGFLVRLCNTRGVNVERIIDATGYLYATASRWRSNAQLGAQ